MAWKNGSFVKDTSSSPTLCMQALSEDSQGERHTFLVINGMPPLNNGIAGTYRDNISRNIPHRYCVSKTHNICAGFFCVKREMRETCLQRIGEHSGFLVNHGTRDSNESESQTTIDSKTSNQ